MTASPNTLSFSSPAIAQRVALWTSDAFDGDTRREIQALVDAGNVKELEDRFYRTLEFGTGGLRGVMGAGTNRMNPTIVAWATQGLANYVSKHADRTKGPLRAAIAHDSRINSRAFAEKAASVLAANGFIVHLNRDLRPTPFLSFAVRRLGCHTGIVVTASHNPKEYNGYKVYWDDGSQVVPPHDKGIIAEVDKVTGNEMVKSMKFDEAVAKGLVQWMGAEMDDAYIAAIRAQRIDAATIKSSSVRVVYTPLHGAGGTLAPQALKDWGFKEIHLEADQMVPDGTFPTAASPNPEEGKALEAAIEEARHSNAELVLATDPDADRLGIAVLHGGDYHLVTGNQLGCLLADYILSRRRDLGTLSKKCGIISTIVTTPLLGAVTRSYGARYAEVLTGFKWIAEKSRQWAKEDPELAFLYGTEESYGYLIGSHCMDKDGIVAACLTAEAAAWAKSQGLTMVDWLDRLYHTHGPRVEWQKSVTMKGQDGAAQIKALMERLKAAPPKSFDGVAVKTVTRVDIGEVRDGQTGAVTGRIDLPSSDVILFDLANGARIVARPSGTEPKIKFYFFLVGDKQSSMEATKAALKALESKKAAFEAEFLKGLGL